MAYAYKKGGTVYLGYKDERGRHIRKKSEATTITEGRRMAEEIERRAERMRLGLEAPPLPPKSFESLAKRYLEDVAAPLADFKGIESRIRVHLLPEFASKMLHDISPGDIEGFLGRKSSSLKPKTCQNLRQTIHAMFAFALRARLIRGTNPVAEVPRRKVPKRAIRFLEPEVVVKVVEAVPKRWRNLFATAVLMGGRRGELFGLRPSDLDMKRRVITLERSHENTTTKNKKARYVPISDELAPFLENALKSARNGILFPDSEGKMISRHINLCKILRRALVRVGIIDHWEYKCRRKGCKHVETSYEKKTIECPKCKFQLWPVAVPPQYQFKDLRSTWGTHACEATGDLRFVQQGLGHSDARVTEEHYAAIRAKHLVNQANKLRFGLTSPASHPALTKKKSEKKLTDYIFKKHQQFQLFRRHAPAPNRTGSLWVRSRLRRFASSCQ